MKSTTITSLALMAMASFSGVFAQSDNHDAGFEYKPRTDPVPNQVTSQGCFLEQGSLKITPITKKGADGKTLVVTVGVCKDECSRLKKDVMAVHGTECLCGDKYPEKESRTKDEKCNTACFGYRQEPCGNIGDYDAWSVYNMGFQMDVKFEEPAPKTTSSSAPSTTETGSSQTSNAPSKDTATNPNEPNSPGNDGSEEKKGGSNVAGIAAGVVVGVVVIAAIVGGGFFFLRRRRNAEIEEEHRRNAAVNAFISGAKPPGSSGNVSMSDSRLEPGLAHRRLSDGSIADNQDYSRKILRVTNA